MADTIPATLQTVIDALMFQGIVLQVVETPEGKHLTPNRPVPTWLGTAITEHRAGLIAHVEGRKPVKTERILTPLEERIVRGWGWLFEREQAGQTDAEYERVLAGWKQLLERYDNEGVA